jgi:manganese/zinc/iron transport system permease protein
VVFAGGVVRTEQCTPPAVDLDADCVLYGQLEAILWLAPTRWSDLADPAVWADLPHQVVVLSAVALLCVVCVTLFYKELALTSFDPNLATTLGYPAGLFHYGVVVLVAVAAIASFEAVGSILVVAMLICPAATARLLTDRLPVQLWLSVLIGGVTGAGGYLLGAFGPSVLAGEPADALNAAGMIATLAGVLLTAAVLFAPRHGILGRRHAALKASDDEQDGGKRNEVVSNAATR